MLAVGLALVTVGIGFNLRSKLGMTTATLVKAKVTPTTAMAAVKTIVAVDIEGEVFNPGVYRLNKGSRVDEALIAAGGLAAKADREWVEKNLNRAEVINDGMKIFIPKKGETLGETIKNDETGSKLININTATVTELDALPGVGPVMAGRIVDYRTANGEFKDINELKMVSGIGDKLYEKIKDLVEI